MIRNVINKRKFQINQTISALVSWPKVLEKEEEVLTTPRSPPENAADKKC